MLNNVNLIGRVTKEIELRKTQSNKSVVKFTLAVDDGKDGQGNMWPKKWTDYSNT